MHAGRSIDNRLHHIMQSIRNTGVRGDSGIQAYVKSAEALRKSVNVADDARIDHAPVCSDEVAWH